ncbi:30S ribosomal protein S1 homolog B [Brassica rapa]|uniref:S1 motif domain-containing protein n=1 Tax=Brassica campestris TaxID=3711 RepID=M4DEQ1_BRACM|nr:30S ribosomal protein S1 homolog B [Brassica rapa]
MAVFGGANLGSVSFSSHLLNQHSCFLSCPLKLLPSSSSSSSSNRTSLLCVVKSFSGSVTAGTDTSSDQSLLRDTSTDAGPPRMSTDWKLAKAYCKSGDTFEGEVEGFNGGGLLIRFHSLVGFLPYPQLTPSRSCKEPQKSIHEIAKTLVGSTLPVKVVQADEENKKLILSEKLALWPKYSQNVNVGDVFTGRVGSVEDYGAFIHLRFDDGLYHLTGLVHVSEVSWDYVQDVRDVLRDGDEVRVIVTNIDKEKSRITLSIKQLEDDPLLETLDKVILKDSSSGSPSLSSSNGDTIEPLPGLETILEELLQEDGIEAVKINRQGFEKRVVSQDLQLWLSNTPPSEGKFVLLARAGRQVQEIHLTTSLDQQGIKKALQRVLERVP